jgi:hypothetical protein
VNRVDLLDRLDFDDDLTIHEQIDSVLAQEPSSVSDGYWFLHLE